MDGLPVVKANLIVLTVAERHILTSSAAAERKSLLDLFGTVCVLNDDGAAYE